MLGDILVVLVAYAAGAGTVLLLGAYKRKQQRKQQQQLPHRVETPATPDVSSSTQHAPSFRRM